MPDATKRLVFRATGLPASQRDAQLQAALTAAINDNLLESERLTFDVTIVPSCYDQHGERNAFVEFRGGVPAFLAALEADPLRSWQVEMGDDDISFDSHFFRFTQLYATKADSSITAE